MAKNTSDLLKAAVDAVQASNVAVEKAAAELQSRDAQRSEAAKSGKTIADLLVKGAYIHETDRQQVYDITGDHVKLAGLLVAVLQHANTPVGPISPGREVEKTAAATRTNGRDDAEAKARKAYDDAIANAV